MLSACLGYCESCCSEHGSVDTSFEILILILLGTYSVVGLLDKTVFTAKGKARGGPLKNEKYRLNTFARGLLGQV